MRDDFEEQLAAVSKTALKVAAASRGKASEEVLHAFAEAGLLGAIAAEDVGGLALPFPFASAIVASAATELLSDPVTEALLCSSFAAAMDRHIAADIAAGRVLATLGWRTGLTATHRDGQLAVSGALSNVVFGHHAAYLVAPVLADGREMLALLDLRAAHIERPEAQSFDLERPRAHLIFNNVPLQHDRLACDPDAVSRFRHGCLLLYGQWLESQAGTCLDATCSYLGARSQFGRPLASLQSVRFTLARCRLELESLRLLLRAAGEAAEPGGALQAEMAYAYAAEVCPAIAEKCLQLNGAMGFTWDVPIHRFLRRIRALTDDHTAATARDTIAALVLSDTD